MSVVWQGLHICECGEDVVPAGKRLCPTCQLTEIVAAWRTARSTPIHDPLRVWDSVKGMIIGALMVGCLWMMFGR